MKIQGNINIITTNNLNKTKIQTTQTQQTKEGQINQITQLKIATKILKSKGLSYCNGWVFLILIFIKTIN